MFEITGIWKFDEYKSIYFLRTKKKIWLWRGVFTAAVLPLIIWDICSGRYPEAMLTGIVLSVLLFFSRVFRTTHCSSCYGQLREFTDKTMQYTLRFEKEQAVLTTAHCREFLDYNRISAVQDQAWGSAVIWERVSGEDWILIVKDDSFIQGNMETWRTFINRLLLKKRGK